MKTFKTFKSLIFNFKCQKTKSNWIEYFINPIAKAMEPWLPGYDIEVRGPMGLGARVMIVVTPKGFTETMRVNRRVKIERIGCMVFEPSFPLDKVDLVNSTKNLNRYAKGTIGEIMGLNCPSVEIVEIPLDADVRFFLKWLKQQNPRADFKPRKPRAKKSQ
jgi:hypothetical protein